MIYAGEQIINLRELVELRAVGALPIGGRYRVIDFPLSNMVNTGIRNVAVITNRNYNSLMDHLGSGKSWDLSRKSDGLFILTPYANRDNPGISLGLIDALKGSMDYIRRAKQEYCILSGSYIIYNRVFDDMMRFHVENGADLTILYDRPSSENYDGERYNDVRLNMDNTGVVTNIEIHPGLSALDRISMDTYIIRKDILIYLVEESVAKGEHHFVEDLIRGNIGRLKVMGFEHTGYVGRMHSVAAYYKVNMDFLDTKLQKALFRGRNRIFTKVKDEVPAKYIGESRVRNSIVANGCIIEGEVENSILFRGVYVGKGANVRNSILLPGTEVNDNAELQYVVIDKNVSVRNRSRLIGNAEFPVVIRKGAMV
ncbi:MAG: glucose-1-phosphate adenylyltransferase subunit GlgD [Clostridiales Family XIII bacterium]|nr:glucose-1-phosphate adenylyltransferase subunit GlgD [Clostridiales Family XIII bacterium]